MCFSHLQGFPGQVLNTIAAIDLNQSSVRSRNAFTIHQRWVDAWRGRQRMRPHTSHPWMPKSPTVREGHKHRVTTPENPRKIPLTPAEPRRDPAGPSERLGGALSETPAEPFERQISSESLAEGCAPRMVTLRNFRKITRDFKSNPQAIGKRCDLKSRFLR